MKQQTAVEWLYENLTKIWWDVKSSKHLLEQAKQMEREQIMQSYNDGKSAIIHIKENKSLEQYYNETYGQ